MTWQRILFFLIFGLTVLTAVTVLGAAQSRNGMRRWAQYEYEMQDPAEDPPDAYREAEYAFARLRYRSYRRRRPNWGTDSNKAERQFVQGVRRLTRIDTRSVEQIVDVDSDDVFNWPWLYAVEVGHWELSDSQAQRLRKYLDRGGFLMVDDFHGTYEWSVFLASLRKIFPDRPVVDVPNEDEIFHVFYDLDKRFQVPGLQYVYSGRTYERDGVTPQWRAIYDDKGRIQVAICHNMDLGDAWEWADNPRYPEPFAGLAFRIGVNYVVYPMTH
jgi:Domain of unknown function (DUF4159)